MMLKEIKPGMAIHCKTEDEYKRLDEEVQNLGFEQLPIRFNNTPFSGDYVYTITEDGVFWDNVTRREYIEFSSLIITELTAEEVLKIYLDIRKCEGRACEDCPLSPSNNNGCSLCGDYADMNDSYIKKLLEICQQWKIDHENKELEIETVGICRIIEIQPNGFKRCVHEEDIDSNLPFGGDEREKVEEILKHYCMEHDGNFIAVHEIVSRVKK